MFVNQELVDPNSSPNWSLWEWEAGKYSCTTINAWACSRIAFDALGYADRACLRGQVYKFMEYRHGEKWMKVRVAVLMNCSADF